MNLVDLYLATLTGKKLEWLSDLVEFMRETYPTVKESLYNNMARYEGEGFYIAFAARSSYFSFYTNERRVFPIIQELSPTAELGKDCARLKYSEHAYYDILTDMIKEIIDRHQAQRSHKIIDFEAIKKWNAIPPEAQRLFLQNVFCSKCGVTEVVDYTIQNDRFGIVILGKCKKCGDKVARVIEDE